MQIDLRDYGILSMFCPQSHAIIVLTVIHVHASCLPLKLNSQTYTHEA